ncbi:MAG TPA: hypothetical protein VM619_14595 [Luteimonas sp.]|nr:hypothetical protein [Luteimonas sp.]
MNITVEKCALCGVTLDPDVDDMERCCCDDCKHHPAARRLGRKVPAATHAGGAREFTLAERTLIRRVHGFMPAEQLLGLLNERLVCDLGPDAARYTMEQLHGEIRDLPGRVPAGDWSALRQLLAHARREGVLDAIDARLVDDFAVVFSLSTAQALRLKDVILSAKESSR